MKLLLFVIGGGVCLAVLALVIIVVASEFSDELLADLDEEPYDWAEDGL